MSAKHASPAEGESPESPDEVPSGAGETFKSVFSLGGLSCWELTKRVLVDSRHDDALGWASQLSFYFILAFFPMMIFACSVTGYFVANQQQTSDTITGYLRPVLPDAGFQMIESVLHQVLGTQHIRWTGLLVALWSASYGVEALINGLNVAFDVRESRSWWKRRLLALLMSGILSAAIAAVLLCLVWGGALGQWMASKTGEAGLFSTLWPVTRWVIVFGFLFATITLLYRVAPNLRTQSLIAVLPGVMAAILLWISASFGFKLYLSFSFSSYKSLYGSLGSLIALMLWLYLSGAALLVGAEVNSEIGWAIKDAGAPGERERSA